MRSIAIGGDLVALGVDAIDEALSRYYESGKVDPDEVIDTAALMAKFAAPGGLIEFVRYFWDVLEPNTELVEGWPLDAICEHLEAISFELLNPPRLLINVPPGFSKSLLTDVFWPAWEWGALGRPYTRYCTFSYSPILTCRDNGKMVRLIRSAKYQRLYGGAFQLTKVGESQVENTETGVKVASSVHGVTTGIRGHRVILDDPHNVLESESKKVREETIRWIRESMSNRLNSTQDGAIVIIMQRVHEEDASGEVLSGELGYCHLMIPMEFDHLVYPVGPDGKVAYEGNDIGWIDPRALDDHGEMITEPEVLADRESELAWEERWSKDEVGRLKITLGPYAYCTPTESPVLMSDLSMRPIGEVKVGDEVIGFVVPAAGPKGRRAHYQKATVLSVSRSTQKVVKIVFASGLTARCTEDHKWFTGSNDCQHPPYAPACVYGSKRNSQHSSGVLRRVCPPYLPMLSADDLRDAGWLGGFFDGEGSVSIMHRRGSDWGRTALVTFSQSAGRNIALCEKLESVLTKFGFCFKMGVRAQVPGWQPSRLYWINASAGRRSKFSSHQHFLHVAQPTKWSDRIVDAATGGNMYTTPEMIVSIEPDGEEEVFGLETTTGNYVVWGLASSNSAQYQQSPTPRKGAVFLRDWWQLWDPPNGKYPNSIQFILASLDSAFTQDEENDPSALTVWGVFIHEAEEKAVLEERLKRGLTLDRNDEQMKVLGSKVLLMHAWQKHLAIHGEEVPKLAGETQAAYEKRAQPKWGLVQWVAHTCKRFQVDRLLIEAKASGISVIQEMTRLYGGESWAVEPVLVGRKGVANDKMARALAVQPTWAQGAVYAPPRDWADMVIDQCARFPKGRDDLVDSSVHAIRWLRTHGLISRPEEISRLYAARADYANVKSARRTAIYPG